MPRGLLVRANHFVVGNKSFIAVALRTAVKLLSGFFTSSQQPVRRCASKPISLSCKRLISLIGLDSGAEIASDRNRIITFGDRRESCMHFGKSMIPSRAWQNRFWVGAGVVLLGVSTNASALAMPAGAVTQTQSLVNINSSVGPSPSTQSVSLATGSSSSASISGVTGSANASVNLGSGVLRADASGNSGFTASATGWEFLTFSGTGSVSFGFDVDGTLSNSKPTGLVQVDSQVRLFDVTTWASYFGSSGGSQFVAVNGSGSPFPFLAGGDFDNAAVRGSSAATCASQFINICTNDSTGSTVSGDLFLDGTASVQADHIYLLQLGLSLSTFNTSLSAFNQAADFSHTATFGFTNLNGLTYESASGEFLTRTTTAVPEPATLALLGLGLAGIGFSRRRKAKA